MLCLVSNITDMGRRSSTGLLTALGRVSTENQRFAGEACLPRSRLGEASAQYMGQRDPIWALLVVCRHATEGKFAPMHVRPFDDVEKYIACLEEPQRAIWHEPRALFNCV